MFSITVKDVDWLVTCARCGRTVPGHRTHLFWTPGGTFRTCAGNYERKCHRLAAVQAVEQKAEGGNDA